MNMIKTMIVSSLFFMSPCFADTEAPKTGTENTKQVDDFDFDNISDETLDAYQAEHNVTYEEPSWPVLKLQEFASWLIVTFPFILTMAAKAVDYKDGFDAWWEAHRNQLVEQYCAEHAEECKQREPNICQLYQHKLIQLMWPKQQNATLS